MTDLEQAAAEAQKFLEETVLRDEHGNPSDGATSVRVVWIDGQPVVQLLVDAQNGSGWRR